MANEKEKKAFESEKQKREFAAKSMKEELNKYRPPLHEPWALTKKVTSSINEKLPQAEEDYKQSLQRLRKEGAAQYNDYISALMSIFQHCSDLNYKMNLKISSAVLEFGGRGVNWVADQFAKADVQFETAVANGNITINVTNLPKDMQEAIGKDPDNSEEANTVDVFRNQTLKAYVDIIGDKNLTFTDQNISYPVEAEVISKDMILNQNPNLDPKAIGGGVLKLKVNGQYLNDQQLKEFLKQNEKTLGEGIADIYKKHLDITPPSKGFFGP